MSADDRYEVQIGSVLLEVEPFEWPANNWQVLELIISERMGWRRLTTAALASLRTLYGGAHGRVFEGSTGLLVQYIEGTGGAPFTVSDWRANSGSFVFSPDDGIEVEEIAVDEGSGSGYYRGRLRLVKIA